MTNTSANLRGCPTRADGAEVLIAHSISGEICHERQRRLYHKCFACAHRGRSAAATVAGLPLVADARDRRPGPSRPPEPLELVLLRDVPRAARA